MLGCTHKVEIHINRFSENPTAPTCLMAAPSLMTKQRFFILRDPQQIRYLRMELQTTFFIVNSFINSIISLLLEFPYSLLNFESLIHNIFFEIIWRFLIVFVAGGGMPGELCEEVLHPVRQDGPERDGQHLPHPPRQGLWHRRGGGDWVVTNVMSPLWLFADLQHPVRERVPHRARGSRGLSNIFHQFWLCIGYLSVPKQILWLANIHSVHENRYKCK